MKISPRLDPKPQQHAPRKGLAVAVSMMLALCSFAPAQGQVVQTFSTSGTFTYVAPPGVTRIVVDCIGGGGRGGTRSSNGQGGGGGGGAYASSVITVVPGNSYTVTVGAGSTSGTSPGGDSWFISPATLMAKGGNSVADNVATGAAGGTAAASVGNRRLSAGTGANGASSFGGGGGSSAGYGGVGANGGAAGNGGTAPGGGGNGGNGPFFSGNGTAGAAPGGGGGGGVKSLFSGTGTGGAGGTGRVVVSYYTEGTCMTGATGINGISDNGCSLSATTRVPVVISGLPTALGTSPGEVRFLSAQLIVAHTFNSDMQITLTSPSGTTRNLVLNKFGSGDNLGNPATCPATLFTLQDGGTALVTANTTNVTGTYAPEETLAGFTGDPNGAWFLNVCDNAGGDVGFIRYVKLNFCASPTATFTAVDNCGANQFNVQVNVTSLGTATTANLDYTVNGVPFSMSGLGTGTTTVGPFPVGSEVICTLSSSLPNCGSVQGAVYSNCPYVIPCGNTISVSHCYRNNDTRTFTFQSGSPFETVTLTFVAGTMHANDVIRTYNGTDNSGTPIPTLTGSFASLVNVTGTSAGDVMYVEIDSDQSNSCATGQQSSWTMEARCTPGCVDPDGTVSVTTNCAAYNFSIGVDVLFTGDASTTTLRYTVNGGAPADVPGLIDFDHVDIGPFAIDDQVNVRLLHENSASCDKNLGTFTDNNTCPGGENCLNALNLATQTSPLSGTTTGRVNDFSFACGTATANTARDAIYYIDVPNGAQLNIRQQSNNYNSQHYVRFGGACPGTTVIACVDDDASEIGWVNWTNTTGASQRVWWIQDGFSTASGNFVLEWQLTTCPVAPGPASVTTSTYSLCQGGSVPGGQGLVASCAPVAQTSSTTFPGGGLISEGTTLTTRATVVVPALPAGAVVTAARLRLTNVEANTSVFGNAQRQNIRVALTGAYSLGQTQLTVSTGPGTVSPNPVINLPGFPAAGGSINFQTRQTTDQLWTNPDVNIGGVVIEVDYTITPVVRWYTAPLAGTLAFTGNIFNPAGTGAVNNNTPGTTHFYATCGFQACENLRVTSSFTVVAAPNAGNSGTLSICSNATPVALSASLGGSPQPGGSWNGPSTVTGGMYEPVTMDAGSYVYTVNGTGPCANAMATVVVTENTATLWYADLDGDGAGDPNSSALACVAPPNHVANNTDLCPADNAKQAPGICGCGVADTDSDGDGTANCNDGCPNDPNKIAPGICGCGVADTDSDSDGTADCLDACPLDPNKIAPGVCGCGIVDQPFTWYADADNDGLGDPAAPLAGHACLQPPNHVANNTDPCPTLTNGNPGDACDDGNAFTFDDQYGPSPSCGCAGTACTQSVSIQFAADGGGLRWTLRSSANNTIVQRSPGYPAYDVPPPSPNYTYTTCLPNGNFYLTVEDEDCNGMVNGGYILSVAGRRIIDNRRNFLSGCSSQISNNQGIGVPHGNDRLLASSCDRVDLRRGVNGTCSDRLTADDTPNGTTGNVYQFWFYDPNGGVSFLFPANSPGPNQVVLSNLPQLADNVLYNVRVRTRTASNTWRAWGPACHMKINNPLGQCPASKLQDEMGNAHLSCGETRNVGNGQQNLVYAKPVNRFVNACAQQNATKYQFRFRIISEGVVIVKSGVGSNPWTYLNAANVVGTPIPVNATISPCKPYEVEVRASFDGGTTWCIGGDPYTDLAPWGDVCMIFTGGCFNSAGQHMAADPTTEGGNVLHMYPNPNRGDQLTLVLERIEDGVELVTVDIYDTFGKRVSARTIAVNATFLNTVIDLNGELATGMYLVNISAGATTFTERLMIQP